MNQRRVALCVVLAVFATILFVPVSRAAGPPALRLPIPIGETWKVIQGYNCGTHTSYDDNAFDLVNNNGRTRHAPVLAAADGTVWWQGGANSVIILAHGDGYYTMYSHLQTRAQLGKGQSVRQGDVIGTVGSAGAGANNPHLHFELFHGTGVTAANRVGVPLRFVEGYDFPDANTCNQYYGALLHHPGVAADRVPPTVPQLTDTSTGDAPIVRWSASDDQTLQGFQLYLGTAPDGTGEWFVEQPEVALPPLAHGHYVLRVRALDAAGNASEWTTLLELDIH